MKSMGEEPVVLPNLSKCKLNYNIYIMSISVSSYLLPFQKVKKCLRINSVPTIMVQFCCSSLYLGIDTVFCHLLLRMTTMDVD